MRREVGLAFGSNLGDKAANIYDAVRRLLHAGAVESLTLSSLYRTAPWGNVAQDWFVNACGIGQTDHSPTELLDICKRIETEMGREPTVRWGPRLIDIDILYMDDLVLDMPRLTLPHAEMLNRAFVLVPLAQLRPALRINGTAISSALNRLDIGETTRLEQPDRTSPE